MRDARDDPRPAAERRSRECGSPQDGGRPTTLASSRANHEDGESRSDPGEGQRPSRRGAGEWLIAGSDVPEDPARDERTGDRCDAVTAAAAAWTAEGFLGEDPLEEPGPGVAVGGGDLRPPPGP